MKVCGLFYQLFVDVFKFIYNISSSFRTNALKLFEYFLKNNEIGYLLNLADVALHVCVFVLSVLALCCCWESLRFCFQRVSQ